MSAKKAGDKHPLDANWCFWLRQSHGSASSQWSDQQMLGHTFGTVEDFWCMINHLTNPFDGTISCDYSIFKEGFKPDYEDEKFKGHGGRIILTLSTNASSRNPARLFEVWVHLLLALIGENFDGMGGEFIGGLRLVVKKSYQVKLEVWTTSKKEDTMKKLGSSLAGVVAPLIDEKTKWNIQFSSFDDSVKMTVEAN